jgi:nitroreductase
MASRAPSQFNSQPWRFIIVEDAARRKELGKIAGESMRRVIEEGAFWQQYKRYFRFNKQEIERTNDGILVDNMPAVLRPFVKYLFTEQAGKVMNAMQVPRVLGNDARKLVERSPVIMGIALNRTEYDPNELKGLYSVISLGAVIQTIWLTATSLGMGFQFISTPQEVPENWQRISAFLHVPDDFELVVLFRLGYVDPSLKRPTIDWTSPQRKGVSELAFREQWGKPFDPSPVSSQPSSSDPQIPQR